MSDRLVTLATFPSVSEAAIARGVLADGGIQSQVTDDMSAWAFSQLLGNVRLIVREADAERAERLLDDALGEPLVVHDEPAAVDDEEVSQFAENLSDRAPADGEPAWNCPACGARVIEDEHRCWSCGASRKGEPNPYYIRPESAVASPPAARDVAVPDPPEHVRDWIDRAWRAAWLSPILLPPLANFYSAWLLLHAARENIELSPKYNRRFYGAFAINLIVTAGAIVLGAAILRSSLLIDP